MKTKSGTTTSDVLKGTGAAERLYGLGGNDTLNGLGGDDILDGGTGNDWLAGGSGNDVYVFTANHGVDKIVEVPGSRGGVDTVRSQVGISALANNVENLVLTGTRNIDATGNPLANGITGNSRSNKLSGLGGNDSLDGGGGSDFLSGGNGHDSLSGGPGNDTLLGGAGNDTLIWQASDGKVDGGGGADTLKLAGATALDLTTVPNSRITGIERIDLAGTNALSLDAVEVKALSDTVNMLTVTGGVGDSVIAGTGWKQVDDEGGYARYTKDGATLRVDLDIDRSGIHIESMEAISLDGVNGFRVIGVTDGDSAGGSVFRAGDVNGDGYDDLVIGASRAEPHGTRSGASYVVFAPAGEFAEIVALSALNGANGFRMSGETQESYAGNVSGIGDFNGDGFADLLVGATFADANGSRSGAAYVVFGRASGFSANLELSALDGTNGFKMPGETESDRLGGAVAGAGDLNGDGYDDLVVGAVIAGSSPSPFGSAYVVFGHASGFQAILQLSSLDGSNGFAFSGAEVGDYAGKSVSSAGDLNGDGFADLLVGASRADPNGYFSGAAYVVYGAASGFAAHLQPSALDGTSGFSISGEAALDDAGTSVSGRGDINGDGFLDLLIGAGGVDTSAEDVGAAYVVFGRPGGFGTNLELSALDGTNGFQISGHVYNDSAGDAVAIAGDVNADGYDDFIVGVRFADENGTNSGAAYVVFGRAGVFSSSLDITAIDGVNGFRIVGEGADFGWTAAGSSVSAAGDVNGDGYADLIVGAPGAGGSSEYAPGAAYVVYGRDFGDVDYAGTPGANVLTGTAAAETFVAGRGNDTLSGGGGLDVYRGGAGDDRIVVGDDGFADVDGGAGFDTLAVQAGADLDLTAIADSRVSGIEAVDLVAGAGSSLLTLARGDVLALSDTSSLLRVTGGVADSVVVTDGEWNDAGVDGNFHVYTLGAARLEIHTAITVVDINVNL